MTTIKMTGRGLRGESFADIARRSGQIGDIVVPGNATDAEVLALLSSQFAQIVASEGYTVIAEVMAATTANITLSGAQTIDGVAVVAGNRVLVKNQSSAAANGIYVAASGSWTRATDFDQTAEVVQGSYVRVMDGATQAGAWVLVTADPLTVGTTAQVWNRFDIDALAILRRSGGSENVGFLQGGTGAVARTVQARLAETVSAFDFIPVDEHADIIAGTSTYDCTADFDDAIAAVKATGTTLLVPGGTYLVSTVTVDGAGYTIDTSGGVTFQQVDGLTGDAEIHPILNFDRCQNVTFGDANFIGNIATDEDEYSHAVALQGVLNVTLGRLYGTDIRGDVLYVSGTAAEPTHSVICTGVSGTNVYRNLLSMAGGEAQVGYVINDGPVGYREWLVEPNAGGFYQSSSLHVGFTRGGAVAIVSADTSLKNGRVSVDLLDLDWDLLAATSPAYPSAPGTNGIALAVSDVRSFSVGLLKLRNYKSYPVSLAERWDSIHFDTLDVENCNQTESTFKSVIVQQGTPGNGLLDIGYVNCVHTANDRWLIRSNSAGLKCRIGAGVVSGGLLSVNTVLTLDSLVLDAGSSTSNIIVSGSLSNISNLSLTNAASATLLFGSSNCKLTGVTGTVGTLASSTSNVNTIDNSVINSKNISGQVVSSDAPATVTAAATITLPLDRDTVVITGNTNITSITVDPHGIRRVVTLQFTGTPTVTDGSNLALSGNFVATADDTLTLRGDGTSWNEVSRSQN